MTSSPPKVTVARGVMEIPSPTSSSDAGVAHGSSWVLTHVGATRGPPGPPAPAASAPPARAGEAALTPATASIAAPPALTGTANPSARSHTRSVESMAASSPSAPHARSHWRPTSRRSPR